MTASDGTRSAGAESPLFSLAANAPQVFVYAPRPDSLFAGRDTVLLEATAFDTEDGVLGDSSVVWRSDIDGPIAHSGFAAIDTGDLTVGEHRLTATATDSDNMAASASVTITVKADNDAPVASDDVAHARAGTPSLVDVLANDTDTEAGIVPYSLSVVVPAASGTARAVMEPPPRLEYRPASRASMCWSTGSVTGIADATPQSW